MSTDALLMCYAEIRIYLLGSSDMSRMHPDIISHFLTRKTNITEEKEHGKIAV